MPYTGVMLVAAQQVCLGPVKHDIMQSEKSRTTPYCVLFVTCNNLLIYNYCCKTGLTCGASIITFQCIFCLVMLQNKVHILLPVLTYCIVTDSGFQGGKAVDFSSWKKCIPEWIAGITESYIHILIFKRDQVLLGGCICCGYFWINDLENTVKTNVIFLFSGGLTAVIYTDTLCTFLMVVGSLTVMGIGNVFVSFCFATNETEILALIFCLPFLKSAKH